MFNACCDVEIDDLNTVWLLKWVMTYVSGKKGAVVMFGIL